MKALFATAGRSALDSLCSLADFVEQAELGVVQLSGEVDVDLVRVDETSGFLPEGVLLFQALLADVHGLGEVVDALAVLEQRDHEFPKFEFAGFEFRLLPGLSGIEEDQRTLIGESLFLEADQVGDDLVACLFIDTVDLLVAGVGDFLGVLGELDLGFE